MRRVTLDVCFRKKEVLSLARSLIFPTRELTIQLLESDYRTLQLQGMREGRSEAAVAQTILSRCLKQAPADGVAPWAADLIAAVEGVLDQYFAGLPRVLDQLVESAAPDDKGGIFRA